MIDKKTLDTLCTALHKKAPDWNTISKLIESASPFINEKIDGDDSLLSFLYKHCNPDTENVLLPLTKLFLENGYDVSANDRFNGGQALHALCWSTHQVEILNTAELLLDTGAYPFFTSDDSDPDGLPGILDSISFKLSHWQMGDAAYANTLEAYYQMIKAAQEGMDYHGIRTVNECYGRVLTRAETTEFCGKHIYILWFDGSPLIVGSHIDFVINPHIAKYSVTTSAADVFSEIIGARLLSLNFLSSTCAMLNFDNGKHLVLSQNLTTTEDSFARVCITTSDNCFDELKSGTIEEILFTSALRYVPVCINYCEDTVYLKTKDKLYLIAAIGEEYTQHRLCCISVNPEWAEDYSKKMKHPHFAADMIKQDRNGDVTALILASSGKYLHFVSTLFRGIEFMLKSEIATGAHSPEYFRNGEKIEFIYRT